MGVLLQILVKLGTLAVHLRRSRTMWLNSRAHQPASVKVRRRTPRPGDLVRPCSHCEASLCVPEQWATKPVQVDDLRTHGTWLKCPRCRQNLVATVGPAWNPHSQGWRSVWLGMHVGTAVAGLWALQGLYASGWLTAAYLLLTVASAFAWRAAHRDRIVLAMLGGVAATIFALCSVGAVGGYAGPMNPRLAGSVMIALLAGAFGLLVWAVLAGRPKLQAGSNIDAFLSATYTNYRWAPLADDASTSQGSSDTGGRHGRPAHASRDDRTALSPGRRPRAPRSRRRR